MCLVHRLRWWMWLCPKWRLDCFLNLSCRFFGRWPRCGGRVLGSHHNPGLMFGSRHRCLSLHRLYFRRPILPQNSFRWTPILVLILKSNWRPLRIWGCFEWKYANSQYYNFENPPCRNSQIFNLELPLVRRAFPQMHQFMFVRIQNMIEIHHSLWSNTHRNASDICRFECTGDRPSFLIQIVEPFIFQLPLLPLLLLC